MATPLRTTNHVRHFGPSCQSHVDFLKENNDMAREIENRVREHFGVAEMAAQGAALANAQDDPAASD